ncbi:MAG: cell division protein ZapC [Aeromonadaceae bacterium]
MILVPDDHWHWMYDEKMDRLLLDLSADMQFATAYRGKQLTDDVRHSAAFSLDDTSHYFHLLECIGELPFAEAERVQIVLNAVAAMRYAKPQMPQSWHLQEFNLLSRPPLLGEVVMLANSFGHADVLVIEPGEKASLCMLLCGELILSEDKTLHVHQLIKVMNNRIIPYSAVCNGQLRLA